MILPQPNVSLVDVCSTIYKNTLYTYSATAFQSLEIATNATWTNLTMGVPVSGGVCVQATPPNNSTAPALWIVGGTTPQSHGYSGLQRYVFQSEKWETIIPAGLVTQDRLYHNAVYLNKTASILIYAGQQDGTNVPSSQTFTINTTAPYDVMSYKSQGAPPAISPLLMQWTESKAVMMGGGPNNSEIFIFEPKRGWSDLGSNLAEPLRESSAVKAVVINGQDGSKNLYTFDMTTSPNTVNRTVIVDTDGNPVPTASAIVSSESGGSFKDNAKSQASQSTTNLTQASWPKYDSSLASATTRRNFTLAKDASGLVVISGGSDTDVLCMFKARKNVWVNATKVFYSAKAVSTQGLGDLDPNEPDAANSTVTSAVGLDDPASRAATLKVLGAVLGSVTGVILLLFAVLMFLRWERDRRAHREAGHQRRASGLDTSEKDVLDFGVIESDIKYGHVQQNSQASFSSMAVLMGKVHPHLTRKRASGGNYGDAGKGFSKHISSPVPEETRSTAAIGANDPASQDATASGPPPVNPLLLPPLRNRPSLLARDAGARRSSGWNKYWSGGTLGLLGFGSKHNSQAQSTRSSTSEYAMGLESTKSSRPPPTAHTTLPSSYVTSYSDGNGGIVTTNPNRVTLPLGESDQRGSSNPDYKLYDNSPPAATPRDAFGLHDQGWGLEVLPYYNTPPAPVEIQRGGYHNSALYSESVSDSDLGYAGGESNLQPQVATTNPVLGYDMAPSPSYSSRSSWINHNR